MFALGFAWQRGLVPLAEESIHRAIALNGEAVATNLQAFAWGRHAAADPAEVESLVAAARPAARRRAPAATFAEQLARREAFLVAYQDAAYAERFRALVDRATSAEATYAPGCSGLAAAVARGYFKLLAVKDEYEVARLYSDGSFARQLADTVEGDLRVTYHMAPPLLDRRDKAGCPVKTAFGPWLRHLLPALSAAKRLRGTPLDLFGYTAERRTERRLTRDYEALVPQLLAGLTPENHATAMALAVLPEAIKGFGPVKERNRLAAKAEEAALLARWRATPPALRLAAE